MLAPVRAGNGRRRTAKIRHGAQPAYAARAKGTGASQHWSAARHGAQSAHAARARGLAHRSTGRRPTWRATGVRSGMPRLRGIDYAAAGLSAQGMRGRREKDMPQGRSLCPRAPDAPIRLPSARHARLLARNFRPCAPDAPICLPPVRPACLPARNFCPCAGRSICLPPVQPARLPARNFRPCAGRISRPPGSSRTETAAPPRAGRSAGRKTRGMAEGLEARLKRLHTPQQN